MSEKDHCPVAHNFHAKNCPFCKGKLVDREKVLTMVSIVDPYKMRFNLREE